MPELPEVETVRRDLEGVITGRRIDTLEIEGARTVRRQDPQELVKRAPGHFVEALRRKGKFLMIDLDDGETIVCHLRMSGQLRWVRDPNVALEKHTHARIVFADGGELRFVDARTFGELWLTTHDVPELDHIGPDALNDLGDWRHLRDLLAGRRSGIKALLLNQEVIAGIGNIYADEALWVARVRFDSFPEFLSPAAFKRLRSAIGEVLSRAVAGRGSTLRDKRYVDLHGGFGEAQHAHHVYDREDQPCDRCGTPISRVRFAGRSSYFCPRCQR